MVFSSDPVYLDHTNWHQLQHPNHQQGHGGEIPQLPPPPPPPQVGGGGSSIRPGSMVDRARLSNLPLPEAGLKCPRCDSSNTKFCYFNNYSLSQPRHFCKTCRRYWTRGGGLRNVPVGGGCRRNKRSKSSSSSKSTVSNDRQMASNSTSDSPSSCSTEITAHFSQPPSQLPLFSAFQNLSQYGGGIIGSNIGRFQPQMLPAGGTSQIDMGFQNSGGNGDILSAGGADQCRLFPFLSGFEPPAGVFPYQNEGVDGLTTMVGEDQLRSMATSSGVTQLPPMKMEENLGFNLSRRFLGISENNQYCGGNAWTECSGVNSSSTNHFL